MDAGVVKFNPLTNANWAGAEYDDAFLGGLGNRFEGFVFRTFFRSFENRVEVRGGSGEFAGAGVYHLVDWCQGGREGVAVELFHELVGKAELFAVDVFFFCEGAVIVNQAVLEITELAKLVEEPFVNHGEGVNVIHTHAAIESFVHGKEAQIARVCHERLEFF